MIQVFQDVPYVLVPHGCFFMGSDKGLPLETPVHERKIESSFLLGMYPVTQKAWLEVMGSSLSWFRSDDLLPVENITWHDAQLFCGQLGAMIGKQVRLPTEAEWEYSCRAGSTSEYYWGPDNREAVEYAWFELNSLDATHPVGEKKPNAWGLHDMVGNVWEWCLDSWVCNYQDKSDFKKAIPLGMGRRVIRGGAWDMDVFRCRSAYRSSEGEFIATKKTGFRVLIEV